MRKTFFLSVLISIVCPVAILAQELNGAMAAVGPSESVSTKINPEPDKALVLVRSQIPNLRFDSNRKIDKVRQVSSADWEVWLPAGTHILKIDAEGYERIELPPTTFARKKIYELKIVEVRAPRSAIGMGHKGSLFVNSIPDGATLKIEGIPLTWKTPVTIPEILSSKWRLTLWKEEYDSLVTTITVLPDTLTRLQPFKLIAQFGFIRYDSLATGKGTILMTNSKQINPIRLQKVGVGQYAITCKNDFFGERTKAFNVLPADTLDIGLKDFFDIGSLRFDPLFSNCITLIDAKIVRPNQSVLVTAGDHLVEAIEPVLGRKTVVVSVGVSENRVVRFEEVYESGVLTLQADVDADISVDGRLMGKRSVSFNTYPGTHEVRFVHSELGVEQRNVSVQSRNESRVVISMLPDRTWSYFASVFPGASQIYKGQTIRGYSYLLLIAGGVASTAYLYLQYNDKKTHYENAVDKYTSATKASDVAAYRKAVLTTYDAADNANKLLRISALATGGLYGLSLLDAFIISPAFGYRSSGAKLPIKIGFNPVDNSLLVSAHVNF